MGALSTEQMPYGLGAHIAEDVSVQRGAMYPGALRVPQADGIV